MGPVDVSGGVHTTQATSKDLRSNLQARILCGLGLSIRTALLSPVGVVMEVHVVLTSLPRVILSPCCRTLFTWTPNERELALFALLLHFMTKQIFVFRFRDPKTKKLLQARIAFQVHMKPGSYKIGPQSIGANEQIDPKFSNSELEWSTKERGATILSALLIKLE